MKTKIIPFDLETAKKIQAGEADGKIKTRCGYAARILCTDLVGNSQPVMAALFTNGAEITSHYTNGGNFFRDEITSDLDLVLEVPNNEPQFKPFDKVLVRDSYKDEWCLALYAYHSNSANLYRMVGGANWIHCIPYEGNEHLLGTTDKPNEE